MKKFYGEPTQVLFVDAEGTRCSGIAYRDEIICGCCGGIFNIEDVIEFAPEYVQHPIHEYDRWIDISDEIRGGEYPESFIIEPAAPIKPNLAEEVIVCEC